MLLLCLAVLALIGLAIAVYLITECRQLDVVAKRLAAEQRIERATRATLKAMRETAMRSRIE